MPTVVSVLSKEVKMATNPVDAGLEYQWRSIPQIVAFIKIYDKEMEDKNKEQGKVDPSLLPMPT